MEALPKSEVGKSVPKLPEVEGVPMNNVVLELSPHNVVEGLLTLKTQLQAFLDEYNKNQPTYRRITGLVVRKNPFIRNTTTPPLHHNISQHLNITTLHWSCLPTMLLKDCLP